MYVLATHPDVQMKLQQEIDAALPNKVSEWRLERERRGEVSVHLSVPLGRSDMMVIKCFVNAMVFYQYELFGKL